MLAAFTYSHGLCRKCTGLFKGSARIIKSCLFRHELLLLRNAEEKSYPKSGKEGGKSGGKCGILRKFFFV